MSVPVLSVQITVADPSASTDGKCRINALRFAIRCVDMASANVRVGSNPSGTRATMIPIAKIKFSQNDSPIACPIKKKTTPNEKAMPTTIRLSLVISNCSGEVPEFAVCVKWAIFPNSVCIPVAKTTARPSPETTEVPANNVFRPCKRSSSDDGAASRALGIDSPVTVALLTRKQKASIIRQSADMLSPSCNKITSPGTRSAARIKLILPSRIALT